jgi:LEA14-like dessication related protein
MYMKKNSVACFFLVFVLFFVSSCKNIDQIEINGVEKVSFRGIEDNTVFFSAGINISNPSGMPFRIKELNLATVADGDFLGTLHCNEDIRIASRKDSVYMVPLSLKLGNFFTGAASLYKLSRQSKVKLEVKGYVRVRSGLVIKKIDISRSQVVDVPKFK